MRKYNFTDVEIRDMRAQHRRRVRRKEIAWQYGVSLSTLDSILYYNHYRNVPDFVNPVGENEGAKK